MFYLFKLVQISGTAPSKNNNKIFNHTSHISKVYIECMFSLFFFYNHFPICSKDLICVKRILLFWRNDFALQLMWASLVGTCWAEVLPFWSANEYNYWCSASHPVFGIRGWRQHEQGIPLDRILPSEGNHNWTESHVEVLLLCPTLGRQRRGPQLLRHRFVLS